MAAAIPPRRLRHVEANETSPLLRSSDGSDASESELSDGEEARPTEEGSVLIEEISTLRLVLILGSAYIGVFFGAVDSTIIATLSGSISSEFQSLDLLSWLATAYLIANAAFQPISGRLTDIFGRGPGLVVCDLLFALGNLICGLATSQSMMIAGRVIAGIGGGGMMSIATFLASDLVPLRKRGIVQGLGNICYGTGAMLGGVMGGLVNDYSKTGWRLAFLLQVPPILIAAGCAAYLIRIPPKTSNRSYLARIDFTGAFLTVSFLVLLLVGLNTGGSMVPWTHWIPLTTIPSSLVLFAGFLYWESRVEQPIIPVSLLLDRTVFAACVTNFFSTMVVLSGVFYIPLYLQILGNSTTQTGVYILSSPIGTSVFSLASGIIMRKTGHYRYLSVIIMSAFVWGTVLFTSFSRDPVGWLIYIAFFLVGGGYGGMLTITLVASVAAVDHSHQAVVTSATYLARSLGSTIGITVSSAIFQNVLQTQLWSELEDVPNAAEIIAKLRESLDAFFGLPEDIRELALNAYLYSFKMVWVTLFVFAAMALITSVFMREHQLHLNLARK